MDERKHFNCLRSFYNAGKCLPDEYRLKYWDALMQYGFTQSIPEGTCVIAQSVLSGIMPVIDKSWAKSRAGQAGGKQSVSKSEANTKQSVSKSEANENKPQGEKGERRKEEGETKKETTKQNTAPLSLSEFETFWELILRKQDKQRAIQAWKQMRKRKDNQHSPEQLAELYNQHYNSASEPRYSKMPSTWLNAGSYLDETTATQQQPSKPQSLPEPEGWRIVKLQYPQDVQQRIGDTWENVPEELKGYLIEDIAKLQTQGIIQ